ncbi:altronate hydrolase [Anaerobacillus alkalilacustris]|uniref:Altronate hydrolase n=1 Tax=Anaerobacillus alkalilacustris TaxID=393763 RepID=A0A1S2LTH9_9BACI|nr:altronate dehydratase family protein [Anaerobacillus alkalilacustris]OIJ14685.1 altronate hydrolase [Anaerobacillus alkalilacustris]
MKADYILVYKNDNVVVALKDLTEGDVITVDGQEIVLRSDTPFGHKIAIKAIEKGDNIIKYGYPIGHASEGIVIGDWVHTHNTKTNLSGTLEYSYDPVEPAKLSVPTKEKTFNGYVRDNGEVGIRNEVWVINTVGCINKTAEIITKMANEQFKDAEIDAVYHYPHLFGCSQLGDDLLNTQKILSNLVHHPNAGAVLVLGLGCENNYVSEFKKVIGDYDENRVKFLVVQEVGDEITESMELMEQLVEYASRFEKQPVPVSKLKVGLKCGGSDAFSGITANPLVGAFSDILISHGGTSVLTEVPEMFGAETILMERAKDQETFSKTVDLVNDFKDYFLKHDQVVYENPSPGNKAGGITTLEEKSLGCVQKGGYSTVVDVLAYGDRLKESGLNLLEGPGNDLVAVTALAAAGAHIVLFTTGRGTPFGGPVPTVKISTNTQLYDKKRNWIDFNAGELLTGKTMDVLSNELFEYIVDLASKEVVTHNEKHGFKEISIFKDGVIL